MRIEQDKVTILIGLCLLDLCLILLQGEVLAIDILEERKAHSTVIELLIAEHTVLNEELDVVPFLLEVLAVIAENLCQFVSHLLGDMAGDLLHIVITLQVRTAHVERNIGRVNHTMKQGQVLWYDILHLVGHEDLVAIELNLIALNINIVLNAREVEDTR